MHTVILSGHTATTNLYDSGRYDSLRYPIATYDPNNTVISGKKKKVKAELDQNGKRTGLNGLYVLVAYIQNGTCVLSSRHGS